MGEEMELHEALAELARDHRPVFSDAAAFRGALDDYLDEGTASAGTINLLTDAVRLGALDQLRSMLASGATPESAVATAGERLARDRGSRDTMGSQWACSILGYALGGVPLELVTGLTPDAVTQEPPPYGGATAVRPPPSSPPPPPPSGSWPAPTEQQKSRTGLILGIVVAAVVLVAGGVAAAVLLLGDDDEEPIEDPTTAASTTETGSTEETTSASPTETEDTDLSDGLTVYGTGYRFELPEGWQDGSDEIGSQPQTSAIDTISLWEGDSIAAARANLIVERASSYGNDDAGDLEDSWRDTVVRSLEAVATTPVEQDDLPDRDLDGETAVGVEVSYENQYNADIRQLAYMTVHDGKQYAVTVTIVNNDDETEPIFHDALDSWEWTE